MANQPGTPGPILQPGQTPSAYPETTGFGKGLQQAPVANPYYAHAYMFAPIVDGVMPISGVETATLPGTSSPFVDLIRESTGIRFKFGIPQTWRGEKGDPGYTPVKGRDYFDGAPGTPGYNPVKGVDYFDGIDGYTPIKGVDYFDGVDGVNAYPLGIQYSIDGASDWHYGYTSGDLYLRMTADGEATWTDPARFMGIDGQDAELPVFTGDRVIVSDEVGQLVAAAITLTQLGYLSDVTSNLQAQLDGKAPVDHTHSYQAADADLLAIAGLTGTSGFLKKVSADTWTLDTASYIPTSASCNKQWSWSGQSGQPTWLWGSNDGNTMYVWNPSNFNVAWAGGASYAQTLDRAYYGVGGTCTDISGQDVCASRPTGFYMGSGCGNAVDSSWHYYTVMKHNDSYLNVTSYPLNASGYVYYRQCRGGTWTSWFRISA